MAFQTYMLEAWAVWPALAAAYLCTRQPWWRRIWQTLLAGSVTLVVSLAGVAVVWLVPASARPYVGGTNSNNPWEMVFGYNPTLAAFQQMVATGEVTYVLGSGASGAGAGSTRAASSATTDISAWATSACTLVPDAPAGASLYSCAAA